MRLTLAGSATDSAAATIACLTSAATTDRSAATIALILPGPV